MRDDRHSIAERPVVAGGLLAFGIIVAIGAFTVASFVVGWIVSRQSENSPVSSLVSTIRADIDQINAASSDWKITEADLEISLAVAKKTGTEVSVDAIDTATGKATAGFERQEGHKLLLRIRRASALPEPAPVVGASSNQSPPSPPRKSAAPKK